MEYKFIFSVALLLLIKPKLYKIFLNICDDQAIVCSNKLMTNNLNENTCRKYASYFFLETFLIKKLL